MGAFEHVTSQNRRGILVSQRIVLLGLIILTVVLQLVAASGKSFWYDEVWSVTVARAPVDEVVEATINDYHPPLYFLMLAGWGRLFGFTELPLKSLSILFVILTVFLAYRFAKRLFGVRVALITAAILSISPVFLTHGHQVRYYSLSAALTLAVALSMYNYLHSGRVHYLAAYILTGVALIYVLYTGLTVILACCVWGILHWHMEDKPVRKLFHWLLAHGLIVLLYQPWLAIMLDVGQSGINLSVLGGNLLFEVAKRIGYLGFAFGVGEAFSPLNPMAWLGIATVTGILAYAFIRGIRLRKCWLLVTILLIPGVSNIVLNTITSYPLSAFEALPQRTLYIYPFLVMMMAYGLSELKTQKMAAISMVLLMVYTVGLFNYFGNQQFTKPVLTVPWLAIAENVQEEIAEDAVVLCNRTDSTCLYYMDRFDLNPYQASDWNELSEQAYSEVWLIQSNVGNKHGQKQNTAAKKIRERIQGEYRQEKIYNYAPQDPSLRRLKSRFLQHAGYHYRVNVYKFSNRIK